MKAFADRLIEASITKQSHVVVGLDPRWDSLPEHLRAMASRNNVDLSPQATALAYYQFGRDIIAAVADVAVAVKPQFAFYEQLGPWGIHALLQTIEYARQQGLLVIGDGKRNDIGSTAEAYAAAYLGSPDGQTKAPMAVDSLTVNAYLGSDGIKPFLKSAAANGAGIFALVKTSNPSSGELQDRRLLPDEKTVYTHVASLVHEWGQQVMGEKGYSSIGAVVGATYPQETAELRQIMPNTYFLVPGYGAQGGTAADAAQAFNQDGLGAVVNSSRGIIFAYQKRPEFGPEKYAQAARQAAVEMREDLNKALAKAGKLAW